MGKDCWDLGLTEKVYVEISLHENMSESWVSTFWRGREERCQEVVWASVKHLNY